MWESGRLLADFQARRKGWETRSLSFPCFPTGWHFHRARWVLSERSDAGYSLPPRFLRIDSPRISIRWALCTSRPRMLSRASDADLLTLTWPPGVGWSRLSSAARQTTKTRAEHLCWPLHYGFSFWPWHSGCWHWHVSSTMPFALAQLSLQYSFPSAG